MTAGQPSRHSGPREIALTLAAAVLAAWLIDIIIHPNRPTLHQVFGCNPAAIGWGGSDGTTDLDKTRIGDGVYRCAASAGHYHLAPVLFI
jgi:hypothetical protein